MPNDDSYLEIAERGIYPPVESCLLCFQCSPAACSQTAVSGCLAILAAAPMCPSRQFSSSIAVVEEGRAMKGEKPR